MNKERLLKVKEAILNSPESFDMSVWAYRPKLYGIGTVLAMQAGVLNKDQEFLCGTTCCLAGHAVTLALKDGKTFGGASVPDAAADYLDLTAIEQSRLFQVSLWPRDFFDRYNESLKAPDRVQVAADLIDYLVAGGAL